MISARLLLILVGLIAAGCSAAASSGAGTPRPLSLDGRDVEYTCGSGAFSPEILERSARDEEEAHPAAAALRAFLAAPNIEADWLPDSGWSLVERDATTAGYISRTAAAAFFSLQLEVVDGSWKVTGWGGCNPEVAFDGVNAANWELDGRVGSDGRTFTALVTERACSGGAEGAGRILPPAILYEPEQVIVIFGVRPLDLPPGVAMGCPANPATEVRVERAEPLAGRALLDGGTYPPVAPTDPYERP